MLCLWQWQLMTFESESSVAAISTHTAHRYARSISHPDPQHPQPGHAYP